VYIFIKRTDSEKAIRVTEVTEVVPFHTRKAYSGSRFVAPFILNVGTSWR